MGLFDVFNTSDQKAAANDQINGITSGLSGLTSDISQGNSDLTTNFTSALQPFLQNYSTATKGTGALSDALGLNGPQGSANATQSFLASNPAYNFNVQQGNNAILASDAASGKTGSGNEALALSNFNQGNAANGFQNYITNLMPFLQSSNTNAAGIAGVDTGLGTALNANANTLGNATYGANTSIGNANANADLAGLGASANLLGAVGGAGKLAAQLLPFLA